MFLPFRKVHIFTSPKESFFSQSERVISFLIRGVQILVNSEGSHFANSEGSHFANSEGS